jgi:hypothetical protein
MPQMKYYWRVRTRLPDRFGQPCRVVTRGKMNARLIEFRDGYRVIAGGNDYRKRPRPIKVLREILA